MEKRFINIFITFSVEVSEDNHAPHTHMFETFEYKLLLANFYLKVILENYLIILMNILLSSHHFFRLKTQSCVFLYLEDRFSA